MVLNRKTVIKRSILMLVLAGTVLQSCGTLPEESASAKPSFSAADAFHIVAKENDVARTLYTKAIVGAGKKKGLKFDEDWEMAEVEAGPLPALFLRGISSEIKSGSVPLGLYLGSDFPVRKSNKFTGKQAELFAQIKEDAEARIFLDSENQLQTAMFPDFGTAAACITCHNEHPETMKTDWKLGDIMGATTWTYPKDSLTYEEVVEIVGAYRKGAIATYNKYLDKMSGFKTEAIPEIGDKWPSEGFYLPTAEVFMDSVGKLASAETMVGILKM